MSTKEAQLALTKWVGNAPCSGDEERAFRAGYHAALAEMEATVRAAKREVLTRLRTMVLVEDAMPKLYATYIADSLASLLDEYTDPNPSGGSDG